MEKDEGGREMGRRQSLGRWEKDVYYSGVAGGG